MWFERFSSVIVDFGTCRSAYNHIVFFKHINLGCVSLIMYVDDIVVTSSDV